MQSLIQIIKVNEPKTGTSAKTGKPYDVLTCECILLKEDGSPDSVGVLDVPKALREQVKVGRFTGSFSLNANWQSRKIEALLVGLIPLPADAVRKGAGA